MTTFAALGTPKALADTLTAQGIVEPFPIQVKTLPDTLAGRDVLGRGRTGSGKTIAFAIPLVARLAEREAKHFRKPGRPMGLVLAPTRELATQINATIEPMAKAMGLNTTVIYGGISQARQEKALRAGVDIVIACPGRLEDLIRQRILTLEAVEVTVLDEADHMADLGFLPVVKKLMDMTPSQGQRLLFSATLDNGVDKIVQRYLSNPLTHSVDDPQAAVTTMEHHVLVVNDQTVKKQLIVELASGAGRRVLFMRTKHHARKLAKTLTDAGIPAVDLHGNLSQNARDRNLAEFSSGDVRVLVATDVAARGVHVDDVELVIHVDPPTEHKAYLHRSGRTARAGSDGTVVTLTLPEQQSRRQEAHEGCRRRGQLRARYRQLPAGCGTGGRNGRQDRSPHPRRTARSQGCAAGRRHLHRCQRRAQARPPLHAGCTHRGWPWRTWRTRPGFGRGSPHGSSALRASRRGLRRPGRCPQRR